MGNMKKGFFRRISGMFRGEPELHPVDLQLAKHWIKQRLVAVFPELRNNPRELELAYQNLGLDAQPGEQAGDNETIFVLKSPGQN